MGCASGTGRVWPVRSLRIVDSHRVFVPIAIGSVTAPFSPRCFVLPLFLAARLGWRLLFLPVADGAYGWCVHELVADMSCCEPTPCASELRDATRNALSRSLSVALTLSIDTMHARMYVHLVGQIVGMGIGAVVIASALLAYRYREKKGLQHNDYVEMYDGVGRELATGQRVRLKHLKKRSDLNGMEGTVIQATTGPHAGRWLVQLEGGQKMVFKPANLDVVRGL